MKKRTRIVQTLAVLAAAVFVTAARGESFSRRLSLEECVRIALDRHARMRVATEDVAIAMARKGQAKSAYYPHLDVSAIYTHLDSDPVFHVPPSGVLKEKLTRNDLFNTAAMLKYPLFTGGLIQNLNKQAAAGVAVAESGRAAAKRDVAFQVKQRYFDVLLARGLAALGQRTLAKLQPLLDITEQVYKGGSEKTTRTEFLQTRMLVQSLKSQVLGWRQDAALALEGLKNSMGVPLEESLDIASGSLPLRFPKIGFEQAYQEALQNNPEWRQINKGIEARAAGVGAAKSGYFPKVGLFGMVSHTEDGFGNLGVFNDANQPLFAVGAGVNMPLFDGFLTRHQVREAKGELAKVQAQKELLQQGLPMMIKKALSDLDKSREQAALAQGVLRDADENRDLTQKSYEMDLKVVDDVIKSQLIEALAGAQHVMAVYQYSVAQAELEKVLGRVE